MRGSTDTKTSSTNNSATFHLTSSTPGGLGILGRPSFVTADTRDASTSDNSGGLRETETGIDQYRPGDDQGVGSFNYPNCGTCPIKDTGWPCPCLLPSISGEVA